MTIVAIPNVPHCGTHDLESKYIHRRKKSWNQPRLMIRGKHGAGYHLGFVPDTEKAVQIYKGPLVQGPWAFAYPIATIIAPNGGTQTEIANDRTAGLLFEIDMDDMIEIESIRFQIKPASKWDDVNIKLIKV